MSSRRALLTLVALAAFLLLPWLGLKPFYTRGEPREALVAQSMFSTGNYILPAGYGDAVPSKPPMLHWWIVLFSKISGAVTEYTSRLPSALAAVLFAAFFFSFLRPRVGVARAFITNLFLLSCFEWFRAASVARVDLLLAVFMATGLLLLYRWNERELAGLPVIAMIAFAGATLVKGPVSLLLPAAIFVAFLWTQKTPYLQIVRACGLVFVPAALLASIWYLLAFAHGGEAFSAKVYYENVARFTSHMEDEPHAHSIFYLFITLVAGILPWSLVFGAPCFTLLRTGERYKRLKASIAGLEPLLRYSLIICLAFFLFYSIPSSKRSVYLLPLYPFLSLLLSGFLLSAAEKQPRYFSLCAKIFAGVVLAASLVLFLAAHNVFDSILRGQRTLWGLDVLKSISLSEMGVRGSLLFLPAIVAIIVLSRQTRETGQASISCLFGLFFAVMLSVDAGVLPSVSTRLSEKSFATEIAGLIPPDTKIYSFGSEFYGASFYLHRQISRLEGEPEKSSVIIVAASDLDELKSQLKGQQIETLSTSTSSVLKPGRRVLLVRPISS